MRELNIPKHMQIELLHDILGDPLTAEESLVDAECDDFEGMVYSLEKIWMKEK